MLKSIYTPVSGALAQERVLEILSNNLANLNTNGFKADKVSFEKLVPEPFKNYDSPLPPANYKLDFNEMMPLAGNELSYVGIADVSRDQTQGPAVQTDNRTDLMLEGKGYFTVNTREGNRLTRNGSLSLNTDGVLTTKTGDPVMGVKGLIYVQQGDFEVNQQGEVFQNGKIIDRLLIQEVANESNLERVGSNYYFHNGPDEDLSPVANPQVSQGYVEGSNVNAIQNLTAMILSHRSYEAYQKAVSNYDQMMEKSSNTLGEIRA